MLGSSPLTVALKHVFGRERPNTDLLLGDPSHSFSFPSGHSFNTTVFVGTLAGFVLFSSARTRDKLLAATTGALMIGAVGASRVYLGYHWATDVLAGWSVGLAWLGVVGLVVLLRPRPVAADPHAEAVGQS